MATVESPFEDFEGSRFQEAVLEYELSGKNLDKVGRRVAEGAQTAKDLTTETVRQVLHVFNSGSK